MTVRERFWMSLAIILGIILFIGGKNLSTVNAGQPEEKSLYEQLKTFTDVLSIVQRDYVEQVQNSKLVEGAIKGMLASLDPHSGYFNPEFYNELQVETTGEFGGLGIEITLKDNLLIVVAPIEGSPAEKVGLHAGDAIVKIDGKFTKDLTLVDAVKTMRGPKGSPITISVYRKGKRDLLDFTIVRDVIKVKSVKSRGLEDGFGYVRISQFQERTTEDLQAALHKLKQKNGGTLNGLILDLRNNPGGLLTQAIRVGDLFLSQGIIVYTDGRVESQKKKFFAHERGTEPPYPIVALVNGGSASASEIVAGALKDHGRALILGERTFGKGSVQTVLPLDNGGALKLTTALYYTKSGRSIQALGVEPDVVMEARVATTSTADEENSVSSINERVRERDLPGSISNPSGKDSTRSKGGKAPPAIIKAEDLRGENIETMDLKKLLSLDPQLERAYELLKTYNIFNSSAVAVAG